MRIKAPLESVDDCIDWRGYRSIILLDLIDNTYVFRDVLVS